MKNTVYVLIKHETIRRTEKVKYTVRIPKNVKNKMLYAEKQVNTCNYMSCKLADIVDSEMLDTEIIGLQPTPTKNSLTELSQNKMIAANIRGW